MDFGAVLHTAQRNEKGVKKEGVRYYSTKFEPPKKEQRNKSQLSANIKKFLEKKEAEEKVKKLEVLKKRDDLLALRAKDKKATRRVNVMLKRTKSANQSVLQDAIDSNNTSVTLAGPIQPDEDDYGYVSQEAAAYYNKMMEKYSKMPDEPKFNLNKKKVSTDLNSTRERVKAAIEREKEEANMPHRRRRKHKEGGEAEATVYQEEAPTSAPVVKRTKMAPPPLNFNELLKLAEKKQFEPIVIEAKPKEDERLLTKKQKKEMEREKEWRERKEGKLPPLDPGANKILKVTQKNNIDNKSGPSDVKKNPSGPLKVTKVEPPKIEKKPNVPPMNTKSGPSFERTKLSIKNPEKIKDLNRSKDFQAPKRLPVEKPRNLPPPNVKPKQFPPPDLKPKQFPPPDLKPKAFPPKDLKPRQGNMKNFNMKKRRILDDDEDYDSEMDDFIDDGPEEEEDYSKYINEIFGYDKSKYRQVDDDIDNMESTFAQQMREEVISTKIGIMEDLEDMKMEEEEKRRKASIKKQQRR